MKHYHNILIVTNTLTKEGARAVRERLMKHDEYGLRVTLLHVSPKIPAFYFQIPSLSDVEGALYSDAKRKMAKINKLLGYPPCNQVVRIGCIETESRKVAKQLDTSFIIYGHPVKHSLLQKGLNFMKHEWYAVLRGLTPFKPITDLISHTPSPYQI